MTKRASLDWIAIGQEFITGTMTLAELSDKHGINGSTLRSHCQKGEWQAKRDAYRQSTTKTALAQAETERANELARINRADLSLANAIRTQIGARLRDARGDDHNDPIPITPRDLRALASAGEAAQRISRLALGASTNNHEHTGKDGGPIEAETTNLNVAVPVEAYQQALKEALREYQ